MDSVVMESACLQAALEYSSAYGLLIVPVRAGDKKPWLSEWEKRASKDAETIEGWWGEVPKSNVGVRLGKDSNIIDIECDDDAAEKKFSQLFGGVEVVTATYAGKRGKHRLFRWSADLPFPHKSVFKIDKLEFRTGNATGAQSVFPPSEHPDGGKYQWLVTIEEAGIAEIPDHVIARLWNWVDGDPEATSDGKPRRPAEHWERIAAGVSKGTRDEDLLSLIGKALSGIGNLEDESTLQANLQMLLAVDRLNSPPLGEKVVKEKFFRLLKKESAKRIAESTKELLPVGIEEKMSGPELPQGLRLERINGDPPTFELYSPVFSKAERGCIVLTAEQLASAAQVQIESNKQAMYPLTDNFLKGWKKNGGLYQKLIPPRAN